VIGIHPQEKDVTIKLVGRCDTCKTYHNYGVVQPSQYAQKVIEWYSKHREDHGCIAEVLSTRRDIPKYFDDRQHEKDGRGPWWLDFKPNADIKIEYVADVAYTFDLGATPLASSATFIAGRESTSVDNTTNKYLDYSVGGFITSGTSPTAGSIRVYLYGSIDDTPTYLDELGGPDADETIGAAELLGVAFPLFGETSVDTTSDFKYGFAPSGIATYFGGIVPTFHGLFAAHDTVAALNTTSGNHVWKYHAVYMTSA